MAKSTISAHLFTLRIVFTPAFQIILLGFMRDLVGRRLLSLHAPFQSTDVSQSVDAFSFSDQHNNNLFLRRVFAVKFICISWLNWCLGSLAHVFVI
jgi:hypothetical protein